MIYEGNLLKMSSALNEKVHYSMTLSGEEIDMNAIIGKELRIDYSGLINCIRCGRKTKKSFGQGYCYPCFISAPETEECVLKPELCKAHEGIARDMKYAEEHCLIDHYVYLAVSSGLKVGVTRHHQIPTRWIDQGAGMAIKLALTPNRYLAGKIEVSLKAHVNDKTNWRKMLTGTAEYENDLVKEKDRIIELLDQDLQQFASDDDEITHIEYPVLNYPEKVKSLSLDKTPVISDTLTGIKGQYLIFASNTVINIRKHNGYRIKLEV